MSFGTTQWHVVLNITHIRICSHSESRSYYLLGKRSLIFAPSVALSLGVVPHSSTFDDCPPDHGFGYAEQHQHQHPMMYGGQDPARNSYQGSPQFNPLMATSPSDEAAQYTRSYMQQKADLLFHQQSMASMYSGCAQAHVALDIDLHSDFGVDIAYPTMSRPSPAVAPISSGSGTLATLRTQPTTVKLTGKPERLIARTVAQLGGPMKSGPTPHTQPALSDLRPSEYDRVLDMPTTEFNHFVKVSGITQEEAADLRKARRRKNNRVYAKRARGKKMAKLNELHATVSHLSALASVSVTVGVAGMPGGRSAMSENVADSHRVKGDGAEDAIKSSSGPVGSF